MIAHDRAGLRNIAELFCKIQQSDFVFDDAIVSIKHEGYLFYGFDVLVGTFIKTGNPQFFNQCVRSGLNYYISDYSDSC